MRQQTHIHYDRAARGSLKLCRDEAALDRAAVAVNQLLSEGLSLRRLSPAQTIELEPSLAEIADQVAGAIHYANDEIGNAYQFCVLLATHAQQQGVQFHFRTEVSSFEMKSGQVTAGKNVGKGVVLGVLGDGLISGLTPYVANTAEYAAPAPVAYPSSTRSSNPLTKRLLHGATSEANHSIRT